ncbi:MAG: chalcone isomerase family protein [Thiotrichales bacterium]|nr:chalcone isomerase family protein [Thiotrichales bacterium]
MKRFALLSSPPTLAFTNLVAKTRKLLLLSLLFSFTNVAHAALPLAGSAEAYWLGLVKVYEAKLFTRADRKNLLDDSTPISLELCYQRAISKSQIIEAAYKALPASLSPKLAEAVKDLHTHFQDVKPGDCYRLSYQPKIGTTLYFNNLPQTTIKAQGFKSVYFGIWLGKTPLSTQVREQLLANL